MTAPSPSLFNLPDGYQLPGRLPSAIVLLALTTLAGLDELAGLVALPANLDRVSPHGTVLPGPYKGDCFEKRSQRFTEVASLLSHAGVPGWSGSAAKAYSDILLQMTYAARNLAAYDATTAEIVNGQASMVNVVHILIETEEDALIVLLAMVLALECRPESMHLAWTLAVTFSGFAIAGAVGALMAALEQSRLAADRANALQYRVPAWSLPIIGVESASSAGVQAGRVGAGSDGVAGDSGLVVGGDVSTAASMPGPASGGLAAVEGSDVGAGGTAVVSPASGPRPSAQSANRAVTGTSLRDRSAVRGPRVESVRDGSAGSAQVAGAAGALSGKRAPLNAGLAEAAVSDADSRAEDLVHA
ncbi:EspA/EspE family type VII secretion system effector [Mycobacterium sp. 050134]|uniref:EspA/EspE family type VII secretion system effector n=1 Tax=Mycobacterium sp. 050134 TaxID=3096111 RepID=UPI002EDAA65E